MKKERFERLVKRSLKKKVKITFGLLVYFMITGNIVYGEAIDEAITSSQKYDKDTVLEKTDGSAIHLEDGTTIEINSGNNDLTIKHNTVTPAVIGDKEGSISLESGVINITAKNFTLDSVTDLKRPPSIGIPYTYGILLKGNEGVNKNININAENTILNLKSNVQLYGIFLGDKASQVNIFGNLKLELEGEERVDALNVIGGKIDIQNQGETFLSSIGEKDSWSIRNSGGIVNINSNDILLNAVSKNSSNAGNIEVLDGGEVALSGNNITLISQGNGHWDTFNILAKEDAIVSIVGKENIILKTENIMEDGDSTSIEAKNFHGKIEIKNSGKTILSAKNDKENGGAHGINIRGDAQNQTGSLEVESEEILISTEGHTRAYGVSLNMVDTNFKSKKTVISSKAKGGFLAFGIFLSNGKLKMESEEIMISGEAETATGIELYNGNLEIESKKTVILLNAKNSTGIAGNDHSNIEINGSLKIDTNIENAVSAISLKAVENSQININKADVGNVNMEISGDIHAEDGGKINLNLNGNKSYFTGNSHVNNMDTDQINLGVSNGAIWKNRGDSEVSELKFNNGIIDMTYESDGQRINIGKISGNNGKIIMDINSNDIDQTNGKTDYISIENGDGQQKHFVEIGNSSISNLINYDFGSGIDEAILIGKTSSNVTLEGSKFSNVRNIFDYTLELKTNIKETANIPDTANNWYVTGINKKEGEVIEKIETDLTLNYMNAALSRLELDTIHKRLGEIRDYTSENGVWARIVSGEMEHDKSSGKFKNDYNMIQVGYDKRKETEKGSVFTGFAVHKRDGKTDFRNGDGKNHNIGISIYKSFAYNDNSYTDIILKYSHLDNDYKNYTENNQKLEADYNTWGGSLSLEHGKKYEKNAWYVTPHVQMNYTYVKGADYSMNSGVRVEQRDIKSLIGRAGIYAGHDFKKSSHFIKAGVLHEFAGEYGAEITGEDASINKKYSGRDTWVEIGIGGQFKVGKTETTHLYYDVERTFGSDFETNWQASVGVRHKF